jgi:hypothetical protein
MGSVAMIYISIFIKIGLGIPKVIVVAGIYRHRENVDVEYA